MFNEFYLDTASDWSEFDRYCWEKPDVYEQILDGQCYILYGRKGAGKTTILEKLSTEKEKIVISVSGYKLDIVELLRKVDTAGLETKADKLSKIKEIIDFVINVNLTVLSR